MPLFEATIEVEPEQIKLILEKHWGLVLGRLIKASQNHTFQASSTDLKAKYSVRVTPDPHGKHVDRITNELTFVKYCAVMKLNHVCSPVAPHQSQALFVVQNKLIVVVFEWAQGKPVNFFTVKWLKDVPLIKAWGRYLAELHCISRKFEQEHSETASKIQNWDQIHDGVLKGTELHEDDLKDIKNASCYGVLHGDLNTSNFYYVRESDHLSVYDSDQTQRGFFEWDIAQAIFGVYMLSEAGMPVSGKPVPQANCKQFEEHMIAGYESVAGPARVNRERLQRMVMLRREFYIKFCRRAMQQGNIPPEMKPFIRFISERLDQQKQ